MTPDHNQHSHYQRLMSRTIVYLSLCSDNSPDQLIFPTDPNDGVRVMTTSEDPCDPILLTAVGERTNGSHAADQGCVLYIRPLLERHLWMRRFGHHTDKLTQPFQARPLMVRFDRILLVVSGPFIVGQGPIMVSTATC
jgi:hypothetical protein